MTDRRTLTVALTLAVSLPAFGADISKDRLCQAIGDTPNVAVSPRDRAFFEDDCFCYRGACVHKEGPKYAALAEQAAKDRKAADAQAAKDRRAAEEREAKEKEREAKEKANRDAAALKRKQARAAETAKVRRAEADREARLVPIRAAHAQLEQSKAGCDQAVQSADSAYDTCRNDSRLQDCAEEALLRGKVRDACGLPW